MRSVHSFFPKRLHRDIQVRRMIPQSLADLLNCAGHVNRISKKCSSLAIVFHVIVSKYRE